MQVKRNLTVLLVLLSFIFSNGSKSYAYFGNTEKVIHQNKDTSIPVVLNIPEVNFNSPTDIFVKSQYSYTILNKFIDLINAVPNSDTVYMSMFLFSYEPIIKAIENADHRKVRFFILVDSSTSESVKQNGIAYDRLSKLSHATYSTIFTSMTYSNGASRAIDHNKFALFSHVRRAKDTLHQVIFQTSNNFTQTQCSYFQDNIILQNKGLYQTYEKVWKDMYSYAKDHMEQYDYTVYQDTAGVNGYFFPKIKNGQYFGTDPVVDILEKITNPSQTTIRILMGTWTTSRKELFMKLENLLTQGAKLELITSQGNSIAESLLELEKKGAYVRLFPVQKSGLKKNVHSKYLLLDGILEGVHQTLVATGSENYTAPALKYNNETLLSFYNPSFFNSYVKNFDEIKNLQ